MHIIFLKPYLPCMQVHLSPAGPNAIFVMWATQVAKVSPTPAAAFMQCEHTFSSFLHVHAEWSQ